MDKDIIRRIAGSLIFTAVLLVFSLAQAAGVPADAWQQVTVPGEVSFAVPPTLEMQTDAFRQAAGITPPAGQKHRIVFQQKGLNAGNAEAGKQYARVIFYMKDTPNVPSLKQDVDYTEQDIASLEQAVRSQYPVTLSDGKRIRLVSMTKPEVRNMKGKPCVYLYYQTQLEQNAFVENHSYMFFNHDRTYELLIMFRGSETGYWAASGKNILDIVNTISISEH